MATCEESCDHLFEAATLSAHLLEVERERDEARKYIREAGDEMRARWNAINEANAEIRRLEAERDTVRTSLAAAEGRLREAATWFEERAKQVGELRSHDGDAYVPGAFGIRAALNGYAQKFRAFLAASPVPVETPRLDPGTIACPLPSCGAKAGEACNRDPDKGRMGVHRVEHPMFHAARIRSLIPQRQEPDNGK